jgi:hypothetical protein
MGGGGGGGTGTEDLITAELEELGVGEWQGSEGEELPRSELLEKEERENPS